MQADPIPVEKFWSTDSNQTTTPYASINTSNKIKIFLYTKEQQKEAGASLPSIVEAASIVTTLSEDIDKALDASSSLSSIWGALVEPPFIPTVDESSNTQNLDQINLSIDELIRLVRHHLNAPYGGRLANRIIFLNKIAEEEFPEQASLSPQSLVDFVAFLSKENYFEYPSVVLTSQGNIRAVWRSGNNRYFAVEFMGNEDVRFVVFAPNPNKPYKTARASGQATLDSLIDLVAPYNILQWAARAIEAA